MRKVVDLFANCEDAATGKQLFTPKTWRVFRSTIEHIRKGCVSDHPDLNYYFLSKVTKDGRRVYHSIRGTSQLEGYHHHLRELVAQAGHSPRMLVALLRGFNYRWNNDMAVDNGDRPSIYRGWYDHWLIEEIQEKTTSWFDEPAHPSWISTKDFMPTLEQFYLPKSAPLTGTLLNTDDDDNELAESDDHVLWRQTPPPALRWLSDVEGHLIPTTRVSTPQEKWLFQENYRRFMSRSASQNAHGAMDYASFAEWWNGRVEAYERDRNFCSGTFRKNAGLLKRHFNERMRGASRDAEPCEQRFETPSEESSRVVHTPVVCRLPLGVDMTTNAAISSAAT